jgi:energy-coupling factor transporter transmembrane protein EcfT
MIIWVLALLLAIAILGGYFVLKLPLLFLLLIVGAGGCILAFLVYGRLEKETEEKVEKLIKEEIKHNE